MEDLLFLRWKYSPNWSTNSVQSLQKFQLPFEAETDKLILKYICKYKGQRIAKEILKNKNKVGLMFSDLL